MEWEKKEGREGGRGEEGREGGKKGGRRKGGGGREGETCTSGAILCMCSLITVDAAAAGPSSLDSGGCSSPFAFVGSCWSLCLCVFACMGVWSSLWAFTFAGSCWLLWA